MKITIFESLMKKEAQSVIVTASGRGLRIVANIGIVHIDVYRDAFYNPNATVFPYSEEHNPLNYVPATGPDTSEDFRYLNSPVTQALNQGYRAETTDVDAVIDRFFAINTYSQGSRHNTMLHLGGYLRWRGVQSWQLDHAIAMACARGVEPGITAKEIEQAIRWGYEHGEEGGNNRPVWGHLGHFSNMYPFQHAGKTENPDSEEITENEKEENEVIEGQCPQFSDHVSRPPHHLRQQEILRPHLHFRSGRSRCR